MTENDSKNNQITPGAQHSFWLDTIPATDFPPLGRGVKVDVAVIGGGIAGLTTAMRLKDAGKSVAVVESDRIINGITGYTTAKTTSLHGLIYRDLTHRLGREAARTYAEANQAAIDQLQSLIKQKSVSCDFRRTFMCVYTESEAGINEIEEEAKAAQRSGLLASYTNDTPLPFDVKSAVRVENQAQFHPGKFLFSLANEIPGAGSHIFEQTRALEIKEGASRVVTTDKGEIEAEDIVIATSFPFYDKEFFFAKLFPYQAYALGVRIRDQIPEGMYYTEDDKHYAIRNQPSADAPLLIISGGIHKVGQGGDTLAYYKYLEKHTRERFDVESIDYYWSTEDFDTPDRLPYIGESDAFKRVYVATGFNGWGMSLGVLSSMIISDLILGRETPWKSLFNSARHNILAAGKEYISESLNFTKEFAKGLIFRSKPQELADLPKGEGRKMVVQRKEVAAYRDEKDNVFVLSPICSHMGCLVNWNNAEKTWDCPCHGSRYSYDGKVIQGPALKDLQPVRFDDEEG